MKSKIILILIFALLASCGTNPGSNTSKPPVDKSTSYLDLADFLTRIPGVQVMKRGESYDIQVRGMSSISGPNEPLFVIDRIQVGSYDQAASLIDPNDIDWVEVLKDVASTNMYGLRGANGVIIIHPKK